MLEDKIVLVVDDEEEVLFVVQETLNSVGCQPLLASSGEEALEMVLARKGKVDLLLTDIFLPSLKGHELAKIVTRKNPRAKVLYMSGFLCPSIPPEELRNREKAFLQKPFSCQSLVQSLKKLTAPPTT